MKKWVYMFSEGDMTMRNLLGGKGANLAEMSSLCCNCKSLWNRKADA